MQLLCAQLFVSGNRVTVFFVYFSRLVSELTLKKKQSRRPSEYKAIRAVPFNLLHR